MIFVPEKVSILTPLPPISKRTCFFNGFELFVDWNFSEVAILMPKIYSVSLYVWRGTRSFKDEIRRVEYVP